MQSRYNYCADAVRALSMPATLPTAGSQPVSQVRPPYRLDFWAMAGTATRENRCGLWLCVHWNIHALAAGSLRGWQLSGYSDKPVPSAEKGVTGERIRISRMLSRAVNRLHDTRDQVLAPAITKELAVFWATLLPYHHKQAEKSGLERCHLEAALNIKPGIRLGIIDALLVHKMAASCRWCFIVAGDTSGVKYELQITSNSLKNYRKRWTLKRSDETHGRSEEGDNPQSNGKLKQLVRLTRYTRTEMYTGRCGFRST